MELDTEELTQETSLVDDFTGEAHLDTKCSPIEDELGEVGKQTLLHGGSRNAYIGTLVGFLESSKPLVEFAGNNSGQALPARSTIALDKRHLGCEAVLLFENSDWQRPIVIGLLHQPQQPVSASTEQAPVALANHVEFQADGDRFVIRAEKEIVLRCGEASITLTRAGKVVIRGTYLVSHSSGMNRIKGGVVHIN